MNKNFGISAKRLSTRTSLFLIVLCGLIAFASSLFNGFVGDDEAVLLENRFYDSLANLPHLFSSKYSAHSAAVFNNQGDRVFHSGSVAYRPVLSFTYFIDHFLWSRSPFGYHLTNTLLHIINACFLFLLVLRVMNIPAVALWSALLFLVHPLAVEAVCAIGYRADVLATVFYLSSFFCFLRQESKNHFVWRMAGYGLFFLGLFSKETVVMFLPMLIFYEWYVARCSWRDLARRKFLRYLALGGILAFYLWVYFFIFPNTDQKYTDWLVSNSIERMTTIFGVFLAYLKEFFLPWTVKTLPPFYRPVTADHLLAEIGALIGAVILAVYWLWRSRGSRSVHFWFMWFILNYILVSNIIPLVSPMANRFFYLPMAGLVVVSVWAIWFFTEKWIAKYRAGIFCVIVLMCCVQTIGLSFAWKNTFVSAWNISRDNPDHPFGFLILGMEYLERKQADLGCPLLEKSLALGGNDPRLYHYLALCHLGDLYKSGYYLSLGQKNWPGYAVYYSGLGRIAFLKGQRGQAREFFEKRISLAPAYNAYAYLLQIAVMDQDIEKKQRILDEARATIPANLYGQLQRLSQEDPGHLPIDIGF